MEIIKIVWEFMKTPIPLGGFEFRLDYMFYFSMILFLWRAYYNLTKKV